MVDADQMIYPTQMQVYLRHWRPSSFTVDPIQEIIMDGNGLDHLRKKVRREEREGGTPSEGMERRNEGRGGRREGRGGGGEGDTALAT